MLNNLVFSEPVTIGSAAPQRAHVSTQLDRSDFSAFSNLFASPTLRGTGSVVANDDLTELSATGSAIKALISKFSMHLSDSLRNGLLAQTKRLVSLDCWDEDDQLPSIDSYRTMLRSIVQMQPQIRPSLGLSEIGYFLAVWRQNSDSISIEFRPNDRVFWVASFAGGIDRTSGQTTSTKMSELFDALGARKLIDGAA